MDGLKQADLATQLKGRAMEFGQIETFYEMKSGTQRTQRGRGRNQTLRYRGLRRERRFAEQE